MPTEERGRRATRPHEDGDDAIDAVDRHLIELLRANGRAGCAEPARQVGLSSPAAHERVGKLQAAGVTTGCCGHRASPGVAGIPALEGAVNALNRIKGCGTHPHHRGAVEQMGGPVWLTTRPRDPR